MNLYGLVAVIAFLGAGALLVRRVDRWIRDRRADQREQHDRDRELRAREITAAERTAAAAEQANVPPPDLTDFPPEMLALANNESEEWARNDMVALVSQAYVEAKGNWDRTNALVGMRIATQPESRLPKHLLVM